VLPWAFSRCTLLYSITWLIRITDMRVLRLQRSHAVSLNNTHQFFLAKVLSGRNLLGGVFPLVTNAMFNNLGFPAASSLLGGIVSLQSDTIYQATNKSAGRGVDHCSLGTCLLRTENSGSKQICECMLCLYW
jgi:hypothetical protein